MPARETVVADPAWVSPLLWLGFPAIGGFLGWLLKELATWVASLRWAPFQGPFRLVASIAEPWATLGALAIGVLAGLVLAGIAHDESVAVTVADDRVAIRHGDTVTDLERDPVSAVFLDGKQLVLLGPGTEELARAKTDQPAARVRAAFVEHGYPWHEDGDPYRSEFRRWVEDMPGLPTGAEALFRARASALAKGDRADAAQLRTELANLGLVVRDDGKRQFWRRHAGS